MCACACVSLVTQTVLKILCYHSHFAKIGSDLFEIFFKSCHFFRLSDISRIMSKPITSISFSRMCQTELVVWLPKVTQHHVSRWDKLSFVWFLGRKTLLENLYRICVIISEENPCKSPNGQVDEPCLGLNLEPIIFLQLIYAKN